MKIKSYLIINYILEYDSYEDVLKAVRNHSRDAGLLNLLVAAWMQSEIRRSIGKLKADRLAIVKNYEVKVPVQHISTEKDIFHCVEDKIVKDIVNTYENGIIVSITSSFVNCFINNP